MPQLTLYYSPNCRYCQKVLVFMKKNNIELPLKDTSSNPANREELKRLGGKMQVPCLVIDGRPLYESDDIVEWINKNLGKR